MLVVGDPSDSARYVRRLSKDGSCVSLLRSNDIHSSSSCCSPSVITLSARTHRLLVELPLPFFPQALQMFPLLSELISARARPRCLLRQLLS